MTGLTDSAARERALDPLRSFIVEAPAGSGKTALLTARFLRLLGLVKRPESILALTFTKKAASEMAQRVADALKAAREGADPPEPGGYEALLSGYAHQALSRHGSSPEARELLVSGELFNITTFHGFCQKIVSAAPLESRLVHGLKIVDDWELNLVMEEAVTSALEELFGLPNGDPRARAAAHWALRMDNRMDALAGLLKRIVQSWDRLADLIEFAREREAREGVSKRVEEVLGEVVSAVLEGLRARFIASELGAAWGEFIGFLRDSGAQAGDILPSKVPSAAREELAAWQAVCGAVLTNAGAPRARFGPKMGGYPGGFSNHPLADLVREFPAEACRLLDMTRTLPGPDEPAFQQTPLEELIIIAAHVLDRYHVAAREAGLMDFVDMEQGALRALGEASDAALWLDARIEHVLVDEFQDTSRAQWELLKLITAEFTPEDARTVFLVGDPKQSIYGWRRAEVALFFEAKAGIPAVGRGILPLEEVRIATNFRSTANLIGFTNSLFEMVMAEPDRIADEVDFGPSAPRPGAPPGEPRGVVAALFSEEEGSAAREREALWLAAEAARVHEENPEETIGILLFARTHLPLYLEKLARAGVPVRVEEGMPLRERPEVREFMNILTLLVRPHDDLAAAGLLRSSFFWADPRLLYDISRAEGAAWEEKIRASAGKVDGLKRVVDALDGARMRLGREPLAHAAFSLWENLGGPELTARFGARGVSNIREAASLLGRAETGVAEETFYRFEALMEESAYEPRDPAAPTSPVMMMTVHRAKGLEFDNVFIPFLDNRPAVGAREPEPFLMARAPKSGSYLMAVLPDRRAADRPDRYYELVKELERLRRVGEAKRVFYVAATRAKKRLFMSGAARLDEGGVPRVSTRGGRPLDWLLGSRAYLEGFNLLMDPEPAAAGARVEGRAKDLPEPLILEPEGPAYRIVAPSGLGEHGEPRFANEYGVSPVPRARGVIIHALMEHAVKGRELPGADGVAAALLAEGLSREEAKELAPGILEEVHLCLEDDFIRGLLHESSERHAELLLEDSPREGEVRSGIVDLIALKDGTYWLVDFKTARPETGDAPDDFIAAQKQEYRAQLRAYLRMFAAAFNVPEDRVAAGLYFTAPRLFVRLF